MNWLETHLRDVPIRLSAGRAAFLPRCGTLLVADLHLGRQHTWRAEGRPISDTTAAASLREPLDRLSRLIADCRPQRVRILGDLLHAPSGLTPAMIDSVASWRRSLDVIIELIPGNHDRRADLILSAWGMQLREPVVIEPPFAFTHEPCSIPDHGAGPLMVWCGHVHPLVVLRTRGDALRLPCFCFGAETALLPAFSGMSAGATIRPEAGDRVFAVSDEGVFDVSASSAPRVRFPRSRAASRVDR
ncbi:MAG: ligase-associated DNA damage response endonuclease PdeM [Phycisphaerales bacterium]